MLKKIVDPELVWDLWQAGLILNEEGNAWSNYETWHRYRGYASSSERTFIVCCNRAYIELEG